MREARVLLSKFAEKQMRKLPRQILISLYDWVRAVERTGLMNVRKILGYHDEPLKGSRVGQRSVRLSRSYRLIYELDKELDEILIIVLEVNKHEY